MKYKFNFNDGHFELCEFLDYAYKRGNKFLASGEFSKDEAVALFNSDRSAMYYDPEYIKKPNSMNLEVIRVEPISDTDYDRYSNRVVDAPKTNFTNIETTRASVIAKISSDCNKAIENGFTFNWEAPHRITLDKYNQMTISNLYHDNNQGNYPWHYSGEDETYITSEVVESIYNCMNIVIRYFISRGDCLKRMIKSESDSNKILSFYFNMPIPEEFKSEQYKDNYTALKNCTIAKIGDGYYEKV